MVIVETKTNEESLNYSGGKERKNEIDSRYIFEEKETGLSEWVLGKDVVLKKEESILAKQRWRNAFRENFVPLSLCLSLLLFFHLHERKSG